MPAADSTIDVTPGTGASVAFEDIGGVDYQVVIPADFAGQLFGSRPLYVYDIPTQVHVASANTVHWDMFNADATFVVRVLSILHRPDMVTAVTGVAFSWLLERSTAVGTGGSALTAVLPDLSQTALDADITARSKPTGGATASTDIRTYQIHSEETNAGSMVLASMGGLELIPPYLQTSGRGIVLRQNQGLRLVQVTNSAAGNSGFSIEFTVE